MYLLIIEDKNGATVSETVVPFGISQDDYNNLFKFALKGYNVSDINIIVKT